MSKTGARRARQQQRIEEQRHSGRVFAMVLVAVVALGGVAIAVGLGERGTEPAGRSPGVEERSGTASALQVVTNAKTVALGHVPLNTTVTPTWELANDGKTDVRIGEPHAEVVEGCCPGPLQVGSPILGPGETTELTFPLQMHPGMDGPHEFSIHVPVERGGEEALLELTTTGHFSD